MENKKGFGRIAAASASALALIIGNGVASKAHGADAPSAPAATKFENPGLYGTFCRTKTGIEFVANKKASETGHLLDRPVGKSGIVDYCVDVRDELLKRGKLKEGGDLLREIYDLKQDVRAHNKALRAAHNPTP